MPAPEITKTREIAICGNPNCGKTTIFNAITGLAQQVGNYPGVTVERIRGQFAHGGRRYVLADIPGTYSLSAFSPDEYIACAALTGSLDASPAPDAIICVLDGTQLERGLYFLLQVLEIGRPTVAAVNMVDIAAKRGLTIDYAALERLTGVPVVPVVGSRGEGIARLVALAAQAADAPPLPPRRRYRAEVENLIERLQATPGNGHRSRAEYLRIVFDADGPAERRFLAAAGGAGRALLERGRSLIRERAGTLAAAETAPLTEAAAELYRQAVRAAASPRPSRSGRIDRFLLHPVLGPIVLVTAMMFVFQSIFSWAEPFMDLIDGLFGRLAAAVESALPAGPLQSLLTDGVIGGVGSVLVFIPQIVILFLFIALLEDSGYMARAAFLVDRMFRWCGLSGKSFIPMLSSFACAVPGILATRTIEDRKLRFITMMVAPLMTCSARLPVYAVMIAAFIPYKTWLGVINLQGLVLTVLYLLGIAVAVAVSFVLQRLVFRAERGTFLMEMPSYKVPTLRSLGIRVIHRARSFVVRAGTVILAITILIWALSYFPRDSRLAESYAERIETAATAAEAQTLANERAGAQLRNSYFARIGHAVEPVFRPLGWDWRITMATLAAFPAREVIIATLGTIFNLGAEVDEESSSLIEKMRQAAWEYGPEAGRPLFTPAVALSIMVFFALCCQCGATLVTIRKETASWRYPLAVFGYMTALSYVTALATYQVFSRVWY
ncbi:MAG TPA: ferrous iron transport protein B [candidate division Zixibacteria bacterium]|nr:ferrous iron transport protein B [candidate division Zixibacteria bacterium]MDD4917868.1 ferrous iron transport protein B [candidate division Zixibacteria bacterium]HOD67460.1 ferrous iron transport protein B [candidate division Zixibacteria bacterium]HPM38106.1 ferrous iron transport protein B [candidate division Zixibacteria bacterium]